MFLKTFSTAGVLLLALQLPVLAQGSTAATGRRIGYSTNRSWQNAYPQSSPGAVNAGLGRTLPTGTQGYAGINAPQLPQCNTGLNAIQSGFNRPAVHQFGTGGFSGGGAKPYTSCYGSGQSGGSLPPCALTPCDLNVAEGGGSSGDGGQGGETPGPGEMPTGEQSGNDPYGFHQGDGSGGSGAGSGGGDPYGFHGGN
jgi:hypothetical protein